MKPFHPLDTPGLRKTLCEKLGVTPQAISNWKNLGEVPIKHCTAIERVSDGYVTRQELRPKDWHLIWPELADPTHRSHINRTVANITEQVMENQNRTPEQLENAIVAQRLLVESHAKAGRMEIAQKAFGVMLQLNQMRTPETVAKMEQERGLR